MTLSFIACDKNEDDFSKKDSYLYVWNIRTWNVGTESKLSDIKVTYFFKGDTTRIQNINFWIIKEKSTLYAEEAMKHTDRAFQVTYPQKDPNQKEFKNQCSFKRRDGFYAKHADKAAAVCIFYAGGMGKKGQCLGRNPG